MGAGASCTSCTSCCDDDKTANSDDTTKENPREPLLGKDTTATTTSKQERCAAWSRETFNGGIIPFPALMDQDDYPLSLPQHKCLVVATVGPVNAGKSHVLLNLSELAQEPLRPSFNKVGIPGFGLRTVETLNNVVWMDVNLPTSGPELVPRSAESVVLDLSKVLLLVVCSAAEAVSELRRLNPRVTGAQECFVVHNYISGEAPQSIDDVDVTQTLRSLAELESALGPAIAEVRRGAVVVRHNRNDRFRHFFLSRSHHQSNSAAFIEMRAIIASYLPSAYPLGALAASLNKVAVEMVECVSGRPAPGSHKKVIEAGDARQLVIRSRDVLSYYGVATLKELAERMKVPGYQIVPCTLQMRDAHERFESDRKAHVVSFDIKCDDDDDARRRLDEQLRWESGLFLTEAKRTVSLRVVGSNGQLVQLHTAWDEYQVGGADAEPVVEVTQKGDHILTVTIFFAPSTSDSAR